MPATNLTRGTMLASHLALARTTLARMKGLLGRDRLPEGEGLLIEPCNSIHMIGMRFPIDAVFLDPRGKALRLYADLKPWRLTRIVWGAASVLELPAGTLARTDTRVGDRIECRGGE